MQVNGLRKWFPVRRGVQSLFSRQKLYVKAVDDISFDIKPREILGLVGESGCGKTTTGRLLAGLVEPTAGTVIFRGRNVSKIRGSAAKNYHKEVQIIFQDPYESLNPRMSIYDIIAEPVQIHNLAAHASDEEEMISNALSEVGLSPPEEFYFRYPHELSGGQRQRVAVARALVLNPKFMVADEPVSMLDVSIRAGVLNLMSDALEKHGVSILFITHDLSVARHMCDRIAIMYLGKVVELGTPDQVVFEPLHPYTKALIAAVPQPNPNAARAHATITGDVPTPINPPSGCRFHPRCPSYIGDICKDVEPPLIDFGKGHLVACHLYPSQGKTIESPLKH